MSRLVQLLLRYSSSQSDNREPSYSYCIIGHSERAVINLSWAVTTLNINSQYYIISATGSLFYLSVETSSPYNAQTRPGSDQLDSESQPVGPLA